VTLFLTDTAGIQGGHRREPYKLTSVRAVYLKHITPFLVPDFKRFSMVYRRGDDWTQLQFVFIILLLLLFKNGLILLPLAHASDCVQEYCRVYPLDIPFKVLIVLLFTRIIYIISH
jgi:hypothetical protein